MRKIYFLKQLIVFVLLFSSSLIFAQNKITSFPYSESFESGIGDWVQSTDDAFDWIINSGTTPYGDSGPENAFNGTNYIYALSVPNYNNEAFIDASFDFSGLSNPVLSFYYHMYGTDMGSLHVDIWNGSWNQDVFIISGQQQTSSSSPWNNIYVDLTAYAITDSTVIRLRSTIGPNYRSDICVDKIEVFEGTDMTYISSTVNQPNTTYVSPNSTDNNIALIEITTEGIFKPLQLDSIFLNSNGTDNFTQDIENVSIYYTGSDDSFSTSYLFGSTTDLTNGILGNVNLARGKNYFWVTYDIASNPTINNLIDVECDSISIQGFSENKIPDITAPTGNRKIKSKSSSYTNFMPANIVVGQPDFYTLNSSIDEYTGYSASSSAVSSKGVFAAGSQGARRILIWNSVPDTNGTPADIIIGNPDFTSIVTGPTATYVNNIEDVCFSPDGEKLIASDGGNNRVLIWNSIPTSNSQPADVVIGQTNFTTSSSGSGPNKFNYPWGVFVTQDGKLIVGDRQNNRFLIFNQIPTSNGASADVVIGQPDMNTTTAGCLINKMNTTTCATVSLDGKLLLSDRGNHRILIYNEFPTEDGASADIVIGQDDFEIESAGLSDFEFNIPIGITVSPQGELAVGDYSNNRVLIFNEIPTENGASADIVLGQPDFNSSTAFNGGISDKSMNRPYGINFDLNGRLYVNGRDMHRVMIFGDLPENTADVEIGIEPDKYAVNVNNDITYAYTFTNNGPSQTSNVVVKCALPALYELNSYMAEKGEFLPFGGTWTIPQLNSGESVTLVLTGTVLEGGENIRTYASIVASDAYDTDLSNNAASVDVLVINETPIISGFAPDTIDEVETPTGPGIPLFKSFNISDTDTDLSKLTLNALSSDISLVDPSTITFDGEGESRQLVFFPNPEISGTVYITIQVSDGFTIAESTYMLVIKSTNTDLNDILIDDVSLVGFDPSIHSYSYELADGVTEIPVVTATVDHPNSIFEIFETDTLAGITTITATSESGSKANYYVNFFNALVALSDATLSDIAVEGETVVGFAPFVYEYTEVLAFGTTLVPNIDATTSNSNATVDIVKALAIPGSDTITVTAEDAVTIQKYIVNYVTDPGSNNANLSAISYSTETGFQMISNFDSEILVYNIESPYGTTFIPEINILPEDMLNANINYTQITSLPGTAIAEITAQDGITTKTYTIEFTLSSASNDATLSELLVNGSPFFGFNPNITDYNLLLENGSSVPSLTAEANHDSATFMVADAITIPGTGTVIVTAQDGLSTLTYNVNFDYEPLSNNADIISLNVNGNLVEGFNTNVYTYDVELPAGTVDMPEVTISIYDENTKYSIVDVTSLPGSATVTVTSEDNSVTNIYTVNFTVALNDDAILSDLQVDAVTVIGFDPAVFVYNIELAEGTTVIPTVTYTLNDVNASDLLTDAASLPGTTTVSVTAEDGVTNLEYVINFSVSVAAGTDASLSDLQVDGETIPDFVSFVYDYTYELPYGTVIVPTVTYTPNDALATPVLTDAASVPGTSSVIVTSQDLSTVLTYNVEFTVTPASDNAYLSDIQIDGMSIPDFDANVIAYTVELPYGTTLVPAVTATTDHSEANESITDAAHIPGTTTIEVTAENTTTIKSYTVEFTHAAPNNDAFLNSLSIDGTPISTFNKNIFEYNVELAIGTTVVPTLTFVLSDDSATTVIADAVSLPGTSSITVTAQDESTELTYNINFTVKQEVGKDATLKDITVNSISIDGFDVNDLEYTVDLPGCTNFTEVIGIANDASASVDVNYPANYPGQVEIEVTSLDETVVITYIVNILAGTDATLRDLKVDGTTISGFNAATLSYDIELPLGTTNAPTVIAKANDIYANAIINDASALPGKTTVKVTAEDGTNELTYEINFTVATSIDELNQDLNIKLYPNPTNGIVYVSLDMNYMSKGSIEVFNSTGSKVYTKDLHNQTETVNEINLSNLPKGMYFVKINTDNISETKKVILK